VKPFLFGLYVEGDLREIRDYISKDSPESARRLMVRFVWKPFACWQTLTTILACWILIL
jgi:hypothetical protein